MLDSEQHVLEFDKTDYSVFVCVVLEHNRLHVLVADFAAQFGERVLDVVLSDLFVVVDVESCKQRVQTVFS